MTSSTVVHARSFLFVPASRPERFLKALESGADCVIFDLEDAVSVDQKDGAREQLAHSFAGFSSEQLARALVRTNASSTPWYDHDLRMLSAWTQQGLAGVMLPKSDDTNRLADAAAVLGAQANLVPLVESLAGLDAATRLAQAPQVVRLAFGHLDFQLDLGMQCSPDEPELFAARFALVAASRRGQLAAPIDGVTTDTVSQVRLVQDTERAKALGFAAKLCIHPSQIACVNQAFMPSAIELAWAERVVQGTGEHQGQAFSLDGRMVDLPVMRAAQMMLDKAASRSNASSRQRMSG